MHGVAVTSCSFSNSHKQIEHVCSSPFFSSEEEEEEEDITRFLKMNVLHGPPSCGLGAEDDEDE